MIAKSYSVQEGEKYFISGKESGFQVQKHILFHLKNLSKLLNWIHPKLVHKRAFDGNDGLHVFLSILLSPTIKICINCSYTC